MTLLRSDRHVMTEKQIEGGGSDNDLQFGAGGFLNLLMFGGPRTRNGVGG